MSHLDLLKQARSLISKPEAWTTMTMARDEHGVPVYIGDGYPACFCALGAMQAAWYDSECSEQDRENALFLLNAQAKARGFHNLADFNDAPTTTHADVLALFDSIIDNSTEGETK